MIALPAPTVWRAGSTHPVVDDARLVPVGILGVLGFAAITLFFAVREGSRIREQRMVFGRSFATVIGSVAAVCLVGTPELYSHYLPGGIAGPYVAVVGSTREVRLSGHDADMLERGYYEDLLSVQRFNSQLWEVYSSWPLNWSRLEDTGVLRVTHDFLKQELVPSQEIHFRSATLSTNRWGMRDKDYSQRPPEGTYRFALVGSSHVMGYGVNDDQTFDWLLENRLNETLRGKPYAAYEVLNFAVDGYTPLQEMMQLESRVLAFQPNAVLYFAHFGAPTRAALHLLDMVQEGVPVPYPELRDILRRAGVEKGINRFEGEQRLSPFRDEILSWAYRKMVADCREHGVVPVWVFLPQVGDVLPENGLARFTHVAEEAGFVVLSLADAFDGHANEEIWFGEWDRHPNAVGHRLLANRLFEKLQDGEAPLLAPSSPQAPPNVRAEGLRR